MANLAAVRSALNSSDLRERFEAAAIISAIDIYQEPVGTANHGPRKAWASAVLNNERFWHDSAYRMIRIGVGTNANFNTNGTGINDAAVVTLVTNLVDSPAVLNFLAVSA
jgi:hypothetical protein